MLKNIIKKILPETVFYKLKLLKLESKKKNKYIKVEKAVNKKYRSIFNKNIDWNNPQTYTEKMNVTKVYGSTELKSSLTDKIQVRKWIESKIGKEYLVPILGIYSTFEEIQFDKLPKKFVIKCSHDSGSVTLVKNKEKAHKLKHKYNYLLKRNYALTSYEMHYNKIEPKIIIEEYMGDDIKDYKFLCFNGKVHYCWVDFDRYTNHKRNIYNLNWELQKFNQKNYGNNIGKNDCPHKFNEMIEIAKKLCQGFDHVRVDLYLIKEKIYFGEMTFTNGSGCEKIEPAEWDYKLGKMWKLNKATKGKNDKIYWYKPELK